ncbi:juvenile hormone esterase [Anopheles aquasalis]|uniref:juvenile hormone esterase n=1 Tax=Anopheles aquasalis TaxID=42839 RepID=UPI00215A8B89|nr:juvenile hormone esterase [Anopheles aquasalis]
MEKYRWCLPVVGLRLLMVIIIFGQSNARTSNKLKVTLPHGGVLIGRYLNSFSGHGILAFLGIPYAKPPIGELRFKAPEPFGKWSGERMAIADAPLCTQRDPYRRDEAISGTEDCLQLNVYVPESPRRLTVSDAEPNSGLPVMVFFHGGGWQCGSGTRSFYGPDFLLEHDVIYIGANFRLGPLGFLSTVQEDCPGNNGLKDQSLVLRWIRDNIAAFGGNPQLVTVFGESAGGASGTYHMMSPLSEGLFHRVISQSGVNLNAWAQPAHPGVARARALQLGEMFNCTQGFDGMFSAMIACLRDVAAEDITKAFYDFYAWDTDPMIPFPPVVEPNLPGAFITKHPRDVSAPHSLGLPWMTGLTLDEGALKSASLINVPSLRHSLNEHWDQALPISLYYDHHNLTRQQEITERINKFYFNNQKLVEKTERNLTNLYSDAWFLAGMNEYLRIRLLSKKTNITSDANVEVGPTYVYLFAQKASASFTEIFEGGKDNYYGVCHAEELQYLFPIAKDLFVTAVPTTVELKIRRIITQLWVNFAKTGNPTPPNTMDDSIPTWPKAEGFPLTYVRIGSIDPSTEPLIAVEVGLFEERSAFWSALQAHHPPGLLTSTSHDEL